ncbi:melanopsin isoform X2 [Nematostella vectensis]|uniref:Opsin n=3 Tax=Nematostella vectensis TaxID=45351 RepID=A9UMY3_NEMVE|nr:melanopsin isoform X2 [Nematostella vectensis]XP_032220956.2 melanopsin isoform X2 [Nematostella vectensis]XP_048581481.1 melanopsin isoform X2 [Nematostella vectensis]XP_048581482.1 melanopsin isoform X2 [Nematostella vectensis]FAA00400.1 TPA: opsin [Nematostella vectensis]
MELFTSYHAITVMYSLLAAGAFVLNGIVLIIFLATRSLRTIPNMILLSMAWADWLMACLADAVGAYANANNWPSMVGGLCVYYGFITTALGLTSMIHLTALSVERFVTVTIPMVRPITETQMLLVVTFLWAFSFLWAIFPLVGWSSYGPEPGYAACSIAWYRQDLNNMSYILCLFMFFFFLPIVIMIACFSSIYFTVRKLTRDSMRRWGASSDSTQQTLAAERKTAWMSFIMVLAFLFAWVPYAVVSLYASFGGVTTIPKLMSTLPAMLAKTSACYNPIIYFFMYSKFRKAFQRFFFKNVIRPSQTGGSSTINSASVIPTSFPRASYAARSSSALPSSTASHSLPGAVNELNVEYLKTNSAN